MDYRGGIGRYKQYLAAVQEKPLVRASLFLIFSLVLLIVLLVLALKPTLVTIAGLVGEIDQKRVIEQRLDEKIASLAAAQRAYQEISAKLPLLDEAVPVKARVGKWVDSVEALAAANGLEATGVSLAGVPMGGKTGDGGGLVEINFTVGATGEYGQIRQFVEQMEKLRRIVKLETVTVTQNDQAEGKLSLTMRGGIGVAY